MLPVVEPVRVPEPVSEPVDDPSKLPLVLDPNKLPLLLELPRLLDELPREEVVPPKRELPLEEELLWARA